MYRDVVGDSLRIREGRRDNGDGVAVRGPPYGCHVDLERHRVHRYLDELDSEVVARLYVYVCVSVRVYVCVCVCVCTHTHTHTLSNAACADVGLTSSGYSMPRSALDQSR